MKVGTKIKFLILLICFAINKYSYSNGCSGSTFSMVYSPHCGCWQVCRDFISDCDSLTDLSWDFGDGTPPYSSLTNPPCHFYLPGTYTVTMTVRGYCHSLFSRQTCHITRTVTAVPNQTSLIADFNYNYGCYRSQALFTQASSLPIGITTYSWDFGDGTTSTVPNPSHVYANCGNHQVSLIVTSQTPCCNVIGRDTVVKIIPFDCVADSVLLTASINIVSPLHALETMPCCKPLSREGFCHIVIYGVMAIPLIHYPISLPAFTP